MKTKRRRLKKPVKFLLLLLLTGGALWIWRTLSDPRIVVALDAGHGGTDVGAVGVLNETELTEPTVQYLAELLEADPAYRVVLCRAAGETVKLNDRWRKARFHRAKLLLSVHGNSAADPTATGFEAYPAPPGREYHEESLRFAQLICRSMAETGITLRGQEGIRYAYYVDGEKILQDPSAEPLEAPSFAMVDYPGCPAVLVEQGFVTNEADMERLAGEEGCRQAAWRYYLAICAYFGTEPSSKTMENVVQ